MIDPHSDHPERETRAGVRPEVSQSVTPDRGSSGTHQPFRHHNAPKCVVCGNPLAVSEQAVGKVCGKVECKNRHVRDQALAELRRQNELQDRMVKIEQTLIESAVIAADPDRIRGVLPLNGRPLKTLTKRRIGVFVDRLMGIISQAAAVHYGNVELQDDGVGYDAPEELSPSQLAILGNGCAVCRGHCCSQGNGHAFIHVDTIVGYMQQHPELRPRDVLQAYVSRIGRKAYEDSCVYQSETGCTLPREMRSKVCNGYLCKGLNQILDQLKQTDAPRVFVISASDYYPDRSDSKPVAISQAATIDQQQVVRHDLRESSAQSHGGDAAINTGTTED